MSGETKKNIKNIFALSIPIIIENILQTLLGTTDTYFAGKISDEAIIGIGVTNLIMNILISFFTAITVGTIAVIARSYGRKNLDGVNSSIIHSIILGTILGIIVGAVCLVFRRPILLLSGADADSIPYAMPYYLIVSVPCVILCLQLILSSCLRAIEDTKIPMYVTGASNIIKILMSVLFMKLGMGVFGLGLSTTLSRLLGMAALFFFLKNHKRIKKLSFCVLAKKEFSTILRVGIPAGAEKLIMRIGQLIYNSMVIHLGAAAYVAHNIAGNLESYSFTPAMGFGLAVCTMVGVSLGENNLLQAKEQTNLAYYISAVVMLVIGVVFFVFAPQLAALFTSTNEVQLNVIMILRIIAFVQPFSALVQIMTSALQGAGDSKYPMYLTFFGIWGIRDGIGFLLAIHFGLGLRGVWYAYVTDLVIRGILLLLRFKKGKWQEINI